MIGILKQRYKKITPNLSVIFYGLPIKNIFRTLDWEQIADDLKIFDGFKSPIRVSQREIN